MIASKAELLDKLRTSGDQVVSKLRGLPPESFEQGRYESGWNGRQILAHIASIEWTYPRLIDVAREAQSPKPAEAPKEASAEPATRAARGGINDYNGRQVEKRAQMSVAELIDEFETNRAKTIAAFEQADESLLSQSIKSAGGITGQLADVVSMIAIAHVDQHARDIAGS
ncbi:MAG: DinB family protein [Chloroflexi bacterium]|nr:MAG: DinB family protein [Chloroflexota bacterium]